jgi:hypothetical protein
MAEDFSVNVSIKNYYVATQTDYITLKINNPLPESWFSISLIGPEKWVQAETSLIKVPGYGSQEIRLIVEPPKDVVPLIYPYQYFLKIARIGTDSVLEKSLLLRVKQITNAIIKDFKLSCTECVDSVDISGTVYNVGSDSIDLSMIFKVGDQIKTLPLGFVNVYGKKDFQTTISLDGWKPDEYGVDAKLIDVNGKEMYDESGSFKIPVIENIVYDKNVSSTIFGSFITVSATNKGNSVADADLKSVDPNAWYSLYSGPSPTGMAIGGSYYWTVSLNPNESRKISYSEVYWPTYAVIIIAIAIIILFYWQSSTFTFTKNLMSGRVLKPGKEVSISLNLKNKSKEIDKAIVRDVVPPGFSVVSKFETVKPMIKKIGSGIELNWKISKLKPDEERVFHYTIKPTDNIGDKKLPSAAVKALQDKKIFKKSSNKISLESEKEETKVMTVKVSK